MIRKSLFQLTKLSLFGIIFLIVGAAMPVQAQNNPWGVADTDTIWLRSPLDRANTIEPITGSIFNAIDPRYIANRNGFTTGQQNKWFELIAFNDSREHLEWVPFATSLTAAVTFNFYIDDMLLNGYSRVLVSALMPQAIEKTSFIPTRGSNRIVSTYIMVTPAPRQQGEVRFYTRTIPNTSSIENTLYLLDGVEITSAIFEAIHPVFIRSLQRITDSDALSNFNRSNLQEVVKVETFTFTEITGITIAFTGSRAGLFLLVNDIELPLDTDRKLKRAFFRTHQTLRPKDEGFEALEQRFPDAREVIVITL